MKALREQGFIETEHRRGTFVAPHPPHLYHYALAFPLPYISGVSRFYEALRSEAGKLRGEERRISDFYDIESHEDVDDYQRLLGFVRAHRLAGLIFAGNPYVLEKMGSPLVREPGLIRLAIMAAGVPVTYPTIYPDTAAFLPKAFDYLAARGRKRVAVLQFGGGGRHAALGLAQSLAAERGLTLRPHWLQAAFVGASDWAQQISLMMFHAGQSERPDAVVITDDNLVEGFTAGIRDSGIRVVDGNEPGDRGDLEVVAQANFPYPTRSHVPAKRLGYNIPQLISVCLERIDQQRRGENVPAHTTIPVVFEDELGRTV